MASEKSALALGYSSQSIGTMRIPCLAELRFDKRKEEGGQPVMNEAEVRHKTVFIGAVSQFPPQR
jgi:hypothetical protein